VPLKERLCRLKQAMNMMMCCDSNRNCPGKVETLGNADTQAGEGSSGLKEGEDVHGNSPTSKKEVKRVLHPSPSNKLSKEQRDDALKAARAALLKMPDNPAKEIMKKSITKLEGNVFAEEGGVLNLNSSTTNRESSPARQAAAPHPLDTLDPKRSTVDVYSYG